jgi:hypothetical protein
MVLQSWLAHALRIEHLLLDVFDRLAAAGIDARVLKGVALAHIAYPEPSWRVFGDVDVLVPSDAFTRSAQILSEALGLRRAVPELRAGFDNRFGKEVLLKSRNGLELDVHRTFVEGALGLTLFAPDLFATSGMCDIGGRQLPTLPAPQLLLHAAYAAVLGDWPPRLSSIRDVAEVLIKLNPDADTVLELAERWRARGVLAQAITTSFDLLSPVPRPPLLDWARSYRAGPFERLLLASHLGSARAYTRHATALLTVPGVSGKLSYVRAIAWPQRAYLECRGFTRGQFAGRAIKRLAPRHRPNRTA